MSAAGPHVANLTAMGIRHVAVPAFTRSTNPLQDVRAFWQLLVLLRRLRPDIVHTHNPKPGILGRIAGRLLRVPLVVNTQHGLYAQPTDRWQRRLPVYAAERIAAAFSHAELVQNVEDAATLTAASMRCGKSSAGMWSIPIRPTVSLPASARGGCGAAPGWPVPHPPPRRAARPHDRS